MLEEEGQEAQLVAPSSSKGGSTRRRRYVERTAKVARWIEQTIGIEKVHEQRGWEYLRKVGDSPQVPRPSNAQEGPTRRSGRLSKKAPGEA